MRLPIALQRQRAVSRFDARGAVVVAARQLDAARQVSLVDTRIGMMKPVAIAYYTCVLQTQFK
jgi:hypothetical protein